MANSKARREKARTADSARSREIAAALDEDDIMQDLQVEGALRAIRVKGAKTICLTCGITKESNHFCPNESDQRCWQCTTTWILDCIKCEGTQLKTVPERSTTRLLGIHQNMWVDSTVQRRKVIDGAIEVAAYLRKNEDLRIDQALKVMSMCLQSLFSFSAPLIRWPESEFKTLTAIWLRAYKNAWNVGRSTAACILTFPRERGGLQVKGQF